MGHFSFYGPFFILWTIWSSLVSYIGRLIWTSQYEDPSPIRLYGGDHKIKHFACHRDFFVHEIPRIKNMQNVSYPGILYPAMEHFAYVLYVGFHAPRYLCDKQNVLFYGHPRISRSQFDQPWSKNGHEFKTKLKCSRKATPHFNLWPNEFILFFRFFTNLSKMRNIKIFSQKRFSPYLENSLPKNFKKFIQFFRWTWDFW